ncbi:hypothetical protein D3C79_1024840 [compost metagenome]
MQAYPQRLFVRQSLRLIALVVVFPSYNESPCPLLQVGFAQALDNLQNRVQQYLGHAYPLFRAAFLL